AGHRLLPPGGARHRRRGPARLGGRDGGSRPGLPEHARRRPAPRPAQRADEARARAARAVAARAGGSAHFSRDTVSAKRPPYTVGPPSERVSRPGPAAAPAVTMREPSTSTASSVL